MASQICALVNQTGWAGIGIAFALAFVSFTGANLLWDWSHEDGC